MMKQKSISTVGRHFCGSFPHLKRLAVLMVLCILLVGCRESIVHNLTESEANRLLTKLHTIGVQSSKVRQADGKWSLEVEEGDAVRAISFLNDTHLLREDSSELSGGSSVLSSREEQRFQLERAKAMEIEYTLSAIDGVLEARVHLNLPARDPLFGQPIGKSDGTGASVLLIAREDLELSEEGVRALVAGAAGLKKESISVLITKGGFRDNPTAPRSGAEDQLLREAYSVSSSPGSAWSFSNLGVQIALSLILVGIGMLYVLWRKKNGQKRKLEEIKNSLSGAMSGEKS